MIEGKRVWARKLLPEPRRCLRCHQIGSNHLAATCPNERDVCGTCGKDHRTADCVVQLREDRYCVNCKTPGHGAWDRSCPTFREKYAAFARNRPEDEYRYYPTSDPRTWETHANPSSDEQEQGYTSADEPEHQPDNTPLRHQRKPPAQSRADARPQDDERPASRPSQKARAAAAAASRPQQATLDRYTVVDKRPRDNGWGERALRRPQKHQQENESGPSNEPLN